MNVTVFKFPAVGEPWFHVHEANCRDLLQTKYVMAERSEEPPWHMEAETKNDVVEDIYPLNERDGDDPSTYNADVKFYPCCAGLA